MFSLLLAGLVLGLPAGFAPGPMLTLVLTQTLKHGPREGFKVALAPLLSDAPIVAASLWLTAAISNTGAAVGIVALAGALFVVYLGVECLRTTGLDARTDAPARSLAKAVAVNLLNPHPYLFWFSVGAPLLLKGWREGPAAAALFLTGFYVCLVGSKLLIAALVGRGRRLLTGRVYVWIMRSLGVALFAFSALFVREGYRLLVH